MNASQQALDWLNRLSLVDRISDAACDAIRKEALTIKMPAGQVILDEGSACDPVLFLNTGRIRVFKRFAEGREVTLYRVGPGEVCAVSVISALGSLPYAATAASVEPLEGFGIPVTTFRTTFGGEPALQRVVMRLVAERIAAVMAAVVEVGFESMDRRLARFLLAAAGSDPKEKLSLSHEEIAAELGTAREVVTRILDSFEANGLVRLGRRRIDLTDTTGLNRLLGKARK